MFVSFPPLSNMLKFSGFSYFIRDLNFRLTFFFFRTMSHPFCLFFFAMKREVSQSPPTPVYAWLVGEKFIQHQIHQRGRDTFPFRGIQKSNKHIIPLANSKKRREPIDPSTQHTKKREGRNTNNARNKNSRVWGWNQKDKKTKGKTYRILLSPSTLSLCLNPFHRVLKKTR